MRSAQEYMIMIMIISMEWDYVSKPRPQTGLLFIFQVIQDHREPLENDIDIGKFLIRLPELSGNPTGRVN
jgi:hypothetical protein